ncbi:MAG: hypothetical protein ACAH95_12035 [Fimbriimonas sp.]
MTKLCTFDQSYREELKTTTIPTTAPNSTGTAGNRELTHVEPAQRISQ